MSERDFATGWQLVVEQLPPGWDLVLRRDPSGRYEAGAMDCTTHVSYPGERLESRGESAADALSDLFDELRKV